MFISFGDFFVVCKKGVFGREVICLDRWWVIFVDLVKLVFCVGW